MPALRKLLGLTGAALALHALVLGWLQAQWREPAALRPMVAPLFTRQIAATAPVTPPPTPAPVQRKKSRQKSPSAPVSKEKFAPEIEALDTQPEVTETTLATVETPPTHDPPSPQADAAASVPPAPDAIAERDTPMAGPAPDTWPADTRLTFDLGGYYRGDLHGKASVQWQREDTRYQVQVTLDFGLLLNMVMTSQGEVTDDGLQPLAYEEAVRGRRRTVRLDAHEITLANGQKLPRPAQVQDTASQFVELSWRFQTGRERLEEGHSVSLWMARPGGADLWTYRIIGRETLYLGRLGEVEAFHLQPLPLANPRGKITADIWFAPTLQYLPVRIRISLGDAQFVDMLVDRIEQR